MSVMNSWCERLFLVSFIVILSIILADFKFYFLPINGLWLILYVICVIIATIWIICVDIKKLLQQNNPFEYKIESSKSFKKIHAFYKIVKKFFKIGHKTKTAKNVNKVNGQTPVMENLPVLNNVPLKHANNVIVAKDIKEKSIDERIEILVLDIEQKFITKWYNLISDEETFTAESKILMEGVIRRILQVSVQMDGNKIICGALVILLKHLKEYRKAIKRVNKIGGSIESVYRYSHVSNKSDLSLEHFTHRLTAHVLREFISWELWNSLPCRLLVSILSKRLTKYVLFYVSQPGWLNYKILYQSASKADISSLELDKYLYISLSDVNLSDKLIKPEANAEQHDNDKTDILETNLSSTPQLSPKRDSNNIFTTDTKVDNSQEHFSKIDSVIRSDSESVIEQALTKMITQQTAPILQRAEKSSSEIKEESGEEPLIVSPKSKSSENSPKTQTPIKRSEPVKIHSAKSSSKRWDENSSELSNVSLGQDLLALEGLDSTGIQGFSGRRLWGYSAELNDHDNDKWEITENWSKDSDAVIIEEGHSLNVSPPKQTERKKFRESLKKASPPSSIPHCLRPATTSASAFVTNTIKPIAGNVTATTLHNMREFQQSTVNNVVRPVSHVAEKAVHKIGDLQDEAVGVVEGIFDFGMAGIRKGLRLTGLQDINEVPSQKATKPQPTPQENVGVKQSPKNAPKLVKLGHVTSTSEDAKSVTKTVPLENPESCWINPIAKESPNGYENQMLLEKSPSVPEVDPPSTEQSAEVLPNNIFLTDSPEYEETADLASTISKLRSLLQQKSSESSLNTPAVSPMPIEDKSCPTPTEQTVPDGTKGDGGMQRFARTVTGMFNTFKTALPGNVAEQMQGKGEQPWIFIENETSVTDLPSLLNSLLVERRDYCTVDTAYEAMDSLEVLTESVNSQIGKIQWDNQIYEDELDDLDNTIPITKALLDVICECLQDTNCALNQEPVMKALLILGGTKAEEHLSYYAEKCLRFINKLIGPLPKNIDDDVLAMDLNTLVSVIEKSFPYYVKELFGHEDIKTGLKFLLSSLQSVKINQDVMMQFFELICSQLIYASSQMSPTPSA